MVTVNSEFAEKGRFAAFQSRQSGTGGRIGSSAEKEDILDESASSTDYRTEYLRRMSYFRGNKWSIRIESVERSLSGG